ncbi:MAG: 3'-5' exonuclease [Candidatus Kerfeldbacteria bacterium]|nr:3'-5' exonuclease [Candidatus Kerfeldbacteria bacterium]
MPTPLDFVVLDVETTGLDPTQGHDVIEIGAQKIHGRDVVGEFVSLVKPSRPLPADVVAFHAQNGITQALLDAEGKLPDAVVPELVTFIGPAVIVGHNVQFDLGFINEHLKRLNRPVLTNQAIDTLEVARKLLLLASYRLSNVAAYLKVPQPSAHRALVDVITTREVFYKLVERAQKK